MESLKGKTALVTGGTRGIGRAIAESLLREGASVSICGRTEDSTSRAVAAMKHLGAIFGHAADITRLDEVWEAFAFLIREFGVIIVVHQRNRAGIPAPRFE